MDKLRAYFKDLQQSKLFRLIVLAIILVALPLIVIIAQKQQETRQRASEIEPQGGGESVAITFSPQAATTYIEEPLSVDIILQAGRNNITGVDFTVKFNQAILPVNNFIPGTQFNSEVINKIDQSLGNFRYVVTNTDPSKIVTGDIKLGTLVLNPKVLGQAEISFLSTQITAFGLPDSISASTPSGIYTVAIKPTSTPTAIPPTVIPTNTPIPTDTPVPPTPTTASIQGDANGDRLVDILDYNIWRDEFIAVNALGGGFRSDFNSDGKIDLLDFNIWRTAFGNGGAITPIITSIPITPTLIPTNTPVPVTIIPVTLTPTPIASAKRVFVTSTTYNGNLGGLAGADAKCQERAGYISSALGGGGSVWKAWLSSGLGLAPMDRLSHSNNQYKLLNNNVIANNWDDLTDGILSKPINVNEFSQPVSSSYAWSNSYANGGWIADGTSSNCSNWSFTTGGVSVGNVNSTSYLWSWGTNVNCSDQARLYCFEQ